MKPLKQSVKILCDELRKDPDYFYSWQANIAVQFQDEFKRVVGEQVLSSHNIHSISNQAAKNFLNLLMRDDSNAKP